MIHPTADVHPTARVPDTARVWNWAQIREHAEIGENAVISKGVYIDHHVRIGNSAKIQNNVSIYHGVTIEDGVFVGPHVCFTNDKVPRAIGPDGVQKGNADWEVTDTRVRYGASLGANATILPGVSVGRFALVGAGAVVTRDVPDNGLVVGNPARLVGYVCECGHRLRGRGAGGAYLCDRCATIVHVGP